MGDNALVRLFSNILLLTDTPVQSEKIDFIFFRFPLPCMQIRLTLRFLKSLCACTIFRNASRQQSQTTATAVRSTYGRSGNLIHILAGRHLKFQHMHLATRTLTYTDANHNSDTRSSVRTCSPALTYPLNLISNNNEYQIASTQSMVTKFVKSDAPAHATHMIAKWWCTITTTVLPTCILFFIALLLLYSSYES